MSQVPRLATSHNTAHERNIFPILRDNRGMLFDAIWVRGYWPDADQEDKRASAVLNCLTGTANGLDGSDGGLCTPKPLRA